MGSRTPEPGVHAGKPTLGSKSGDPTHCDQNSATRNATSASGTTCMEKSRPSNQHQHPLGSFTTSVGKSATPKPGTNATTAEIPGATHNARNEAATGVTPTSHVPEANGTRTHGRTRRRPPLDTTRVICGATLGPAVRTTLTTFPAPPLPFTA